MSDLHLAISEVWHLLDDAPSPAPSHRNRTITRWGEVMETAKKRLAGIGKRAMALEDDLALLQARLVAAQQDQHAAAKHAAGLSAEIERLRQENRLILDAMGMEKYRVRWRPVVEGGELPASGAPVLAAVGEPVGTSGIRRRWVARAMYVARFTIPDNGDKDMYWWPAGWYEWNESDDMHYMISGEVTHWAALPGLPEGD